WVLDTAPVERLITTRPVTFSAKIGQHEGFETAAPLAAPADTSAHYHHRTRRASGGVPADCAAGCRGALDLRCACLCRTGAQRWDRPAPRCTAQCIPPGSSGAGGPLRCRFGQRAT